MRAVLSLAPAYRLAQWLIGAEHSRQVLVDEILHVSPDMRLLDIGCGTADILEHLPDIDYVGFDPNERYIADARARFGQRAQFFTAGAEIFQTAGDGFDLATAIGVLHHMNDEVADDAVALAAGALTKNGRLISIDPTIVDDQHPVARFLVSRDRGRYVRSPGKTAELIQRHFRHVDVQVRHDLLRPPYSHVIATASEPIRSCSAATSLQRSDE